MESLRFYIEWVLNMFSNKCTCLTHTIARFRHWYIIPKAIFRLCFILLNNAYCIPTYVVWMVLLSPIRKLNPDAFWKIEGYFFHWLLAMVSMWSWSAGYDGIYFYMARVCISKLFLSAVVEVGDDISECIDEKTLVIANHQSTADVPFLMACFNTRRNILPNLMWIMDRLFKYTNFGIVSVIHQDFFIMSVSHFFLFTMFNWTVFLFSNKITCK